MFSDSDVRKCIPSVCAGCEHPHGQEELACTQTRGTLDMAAHLLPASQPACHLLRGFQHIEGVSDGAVLGGEVQGAWVSRGLEGCMAQCAPASKRGLGTDLPWI